MQVGREATTGEKGGKGTDSYTKRRSFPLVIVKCLPPASVRFYGLPSHQRHQQRSQLLLTVLTDENSFFRFSMEADRTKWKKGSRFYSLSHTRAAGIAAN